MHDAIISTKRGPSKKLREIDFFEKFVIVLLGYILFMCAEEKKF